MLVFEAVKLVGTLKFTWPLRVVWVTWTGNCCTQEQVRSEGDHDLSDDVLAVLFKFMAEVRVRAVPPYDRMTEGYSCSWSRWFV